MRQNERIWWISATALSLAAFSYFAGLGVRGLYTRLSGERYADGRPVASYPRFASAAPRVADPEASLRPATLYWEVLRKLNLYYVEQLPADTRLAQGSVDSMLNQLDDPGTRLLSKTEFEALQAAANGQYNGLGAVLTVKRYNRETPEMEAEAPLPKNKQPQSPGIKTLTVVSVAAGGAAEKAGLQPGDRITEIDGHWVAPAHVSYRLLTQLTDPLGPQDLKPRDPDEPVENKPPDPEREKAKKEAEEISARWKNATDMPSAIQLLLGNSRENHELTIERGAPAKTLRVNVSLGATRTPVFSTRKLNPTTGYIQILAFNGGTAKQVETALADFQKSGVKSLVIDLRNSPGGSLDAAQDTASLLLGSAKFAVLKERDASRKLVDHPLTLKGSARFKPAAVSVVVDGGTAGTSELFAAVLREQLGARLVGTTTFGDGTEQALFRLDDGSGVSVTRAKMLTSKALDFDGKGLKADVAPQGDPLDTAVRALSTPVVAGGNRGS